MISLLSSSKNFRHPWVGNHKLNQLGIHGHRIRLAHCASNIRTFFSGARHTELTNNLSENGYTIVPDFLPQANFDKLYAQVKAQTSRSFEINPPNPPSKRGFGKKDLFEGGFDRYDGSTLNRFLDKDHIEPSLLNSFIKNPILDSLCKKSSGFSPDRKRLAIYLTINGETLKNPDNQRILHRDTFHNTLKFWYFLDDVTEEDGPFTYVPKSHKINEKRLAWENHQARVSCGAITDPMSLNSGGGGSFRAHEHELEAMGYPPPKSLVVSANTLILADTFGFHRRGDAKPNTQRLALYGWRRPWPFIVKGW